MKVLLDTHAFLWWIMDDPRLSATAREIIREGHNELYFSAASGWEIAIKVSLGRLDLRRPPSRFVPEQMARNRIESLPVEMSHALAVGLLPHHHRDPFDRLLGVQSRAQNLPILSSDPMLRRYDAEVLW